MKFTTPARRVLAAGAVSALAAGALVATTATTASAAPIQNVYTCTGGPSGPFEMTLDSDIQGLAAVPQVPAGLDVPASFAALDVTNTVTVPTDIVNAIGGFERVESPDFAGTFGAVSIAVNGVGANIADAVDNGDGTSSFVAPGTNAAFEVPAAGTYDVLSPAAMTLEVKDSAGNTPLAVTCALPDGVTPGSYATVEVVKNASTSTAKPTATSFKKGDVAKVKVRVAAENETPTGKVVLKRGVKPSGKTLAVANLNVKGVAILKTKGLVVGKNKVTAYYKGDGYTNTSSDTTVVKVVR